MRGGSAFAVGADNSRGVYISLFCDAAVFNNGSGVCAEAYQRNVLAREAVRQDICRSCLSHVPAVLSYNDRDKRAQVDIIRAAMAADVAHIA